MRADRNKLELAMARACMNAKDIAIKAGIRITSLDFDFLECVSDWVKEHYPNGELSGGFSRDRIRPAEYVDEGRYRYTLACSQNKKGIAAKRALWAEFFDETFHRKDMDADAEKQKILRDIEQGKAAAHKDAAEMDKETNAMLIYRDPATGWLYRVSPQPEHGSYVMQYRDPANSATWKWCANWNIGNIYRESLEEVLEARAKRDGWELVSGPASSEPPEVVYEGEEYSPCDTCRCPDCIESSCPQAGCDKTDGGFGCFAPYEECPAPAEELKAEREAREKAEHEAELDRKEREDAHAAALRYKAEADRRAQDQNRLEGLVQTVTHERDGARQALAAAKLRGDKLKEENDALREQPIRGDFADADEIDRRAQEKAEAMTAEYRDQIAELQDRAETGDANACYDQVILASRALENAWTLAKSAYKRLPAGMRTYPREMLHNAFAKFEEELKCL